MATSPKSTSKKRAPAAAQSQDIKGIVKQAEAFCRTWILPYWKQVLVGIVGAVVVVIAVQAVASRRQAAEARAFLALKEAKDSDALKEVVAAFPGSAAALQADLQVAKQLFEEGRYDQAATRFAALYAKKVPASVKRAAQVGEAYALEGDGQLAVAKKRFVALAEQLDNPPAVVDAYNGAGRCAAAQGKFAEAAKWYQLAVDAAGGEPMLERLAKDNLDSLNTKRYAVAPMAPEETPASDAAEAAAPATE